MLWASKHLVWANEWKLLPVHGQVKLRNISESLTQVTSKENCYKLLSEGLDKNVCFLQIA